MRTLLLVFFAGLLLAQSVPSPSVPREPRDRAEGQHRTHKKESVAQHGPESPTLPPTADAGRIDKPTARNQTEEPKQKTNQIWEEVLLPETWANWALVIVGIVAARIALKTLGAIQRQVAANEVSADAAKTSADTAARQAELAEKALHLTERADILIDAVSISTYPDFTPESEIKICFKNYGRTRGHDIRANVRLFVPDMENSATEAAPLPTTVVGAGDTYICGFQPLRDWLTGETYYGICNGQIPLRFEAQVVYSDVFGRPHSSRYSGVFRWESSSFRMDRDQEAD
jgi:hypothetical protein